MNLIVRQPLFGQVWATLPNCAYFISRHWIFIKYEWNGTKTSTNFSLAYWCKPFWPPTTSGQIRATLPDCACFTSRHWIFIKHEWNGTKPLQIIFWHMDMNLTVRQPHPGKFGQPCPIGHVLLLGTESSSNMNGMEPNFYKLFSGIWTWTLLSVNHIRARLGNFARLGIFYFKALNHYIWSLLHITFQL